MPTARAIHTIIGLLLKAMREQRHKNVRIIIATQEPTVSPKLLDLCFMSLLHNFQSPGWLKTLQPHLVGVYRAVDGSGQTFRDLLTKVAKLRRGEGLLFYPKARLEADGKTSRRLDTECRRFKARFEVE